MCFEKFFHDAVFHAVEHRCANRFEERKAGFLVHVDLVHEKAVLAERSAALEDGAVFLVGDVVDVAGEFKVCWFLTEQAGKRERVLVGLHIIAEIEHIVMRSW